MAILYAVSLFRDNYNLPDEQLKVKLARLGNLVDIITVLEFLYTYIVFGKEWHQPQRLHPAQNLS